jgi:hypothetical protein
METPLMTTDAPLTRDLAAVKNHVLASVQTEFNRLVALAESGTRPRDLEIAVLKAVFTLGRLILATLLSVLCRRCTERDLQRRGLSSAQTTLRLEQDYWATQTTTLGQISFPMFAYRERRGGLSVTRTPARDEVLALHGHVRSSVLCLEWECRLGSDFPFRRAQEALSFFTHGVVSLEDTTIASHMVAVGSAIERHWLYRPLEEIQEILKNRAERDQRSGRPVMYGSTDAHAGRRYVDATWDAVWKMANGIRFWCIDRHTGQPIHLGGEYTWGDCEQVSLIVSQLVEEGWLPRNGDYGGGVVAELVIVTDGLPWIKDHFVARLPWAQAVLDIYHALECLGRFAKTRFGKAKKKAKAWFRRMAQHLLPKGPKAHEAKTRRGHKKSPKGQSQARQRQVRTSRPAASGWDLLGALYEESVPDKYAEDFNKLLKYFENNAYRMEYDQYRQRGFQIGSGAMESLHRSAAQLRLKLPGARWLETTSQAIFNLRLLQLSGRWSEFWKQPDLTCQLRHAFESDRQRKNQTEAA